MNLYRGCQHQCIYCDSRSKVYQLGNLNHIRVKENAIDLLDKKLRSLLLTTASKNKWNSKRYPYSDKYMIRTANNFVTAKDVKVVKVGMVTNWRISKNSLGIPLHKYGYGYILFQKQGEPFKRGYRAKFFREYNGSSYEQISEMTLISEITPFK